MIDTNIYSSSAFIQLLEVSRGLTLKDIATRTGDTVERLERVVNGSEQLGFNTYNQLRLSIDDLEEVDYDGSYSAY